MSTDNLFEGYTLDELSKLAEKDPEKFEAVASEIKQKHLDRLCNERPEKELQLRGLQFRIDATLKPIKNPLVRAQKMYNMMIQEGLYKLQDALNNESSIKKTLEKNKIIPFKRSDK